MVESASTNPQLIIITGVMAAGKSTVAQHLAERLPRSVHLRGDLFRRLIVNGQAEMTADLSSEAMAQLRLRYRLAATVAEQYLQANFSVIYQDIILGPMLTEVVNYFQHDPLHLVVLCPRPATVAAREAARPKTGYRGITVADLDGALRTETPRLGLWLDNSDLTVSETVDQILANLDQALIQVEGGSS